MRYVKIKNGPIEENAYLVFDEASKEAAVIDPGFSEPEDYDKHVKEEGLTIRYIINTHGHWDHIKNNKSLKERYKARLLIHGNDQEYLMNSELNLSYYYDKEIEIAAADRLLVDEDTIMLGTSELKVMHTPGHTLGSIIIYNDELAFTGDTLFYGSIGRCDLPGSDKEIMSATIDKYKSLIPLQAKILPGHGSMESTFKEQLEINPFLTGKMKPK